MENTGKGWKIHFCGENLLNSTAFSRFFSEPPQSDKRSVLYDQKKKKSLQQILIALALVILLKLLLSVLPALPTPVELLLYLIPYLVVGKDVLRKAIKGVKNRQPFDECFLMAVATVGAFALGDYVEGCAVILFYQIGELFQSVAVGKSRQSISSLMDIRPDYSNVEDEDGKLEQVDPDDVEVGTVIVVQPGERVPIDGVIVEGTSALNTAALTGESLPRDVQTGDEVISGCVNMTGLLKVRTTKEFGESTVSKILDLVENSSMKKARAENFITRFARVYTPAVCYGALALAFLPPIVLLLMGQPARFGDWIYRALTFLVISCPCALVISIPLSFFGGIGGASACGILVKGSTYLEELARTGIVVFDKTGTLTQGTFKVTGVHPADGITDEQLVEAAALAESWSKHPISLSIKAAYGKEIDTSRVTDVEELGGHGVTAKVDGKAVAAGNARLMERWAFLPRRERDRHRRARCHRRQIRRLPAHRRRGQTPQCRGHPGPEGRRSAQDRHAHRRCRAGGQGRFCPAGSGRIPRRSAARRQGGPDREADRRKEAQGKPRLRGRRHQRRPGAVPRRCGHRHGCLAQTPPSRPPTWC